MIKKIFLHIGIHKTATSSIQEALGKGKDILASYGYLYPIFNRKKDLIYNHSEVFYSLFCQNPHQYYMNIVKGFNSKDLVDELHKNYKDQLKSQLQVFKGDFLMISGEDISMFAIQELEKLKDFLIEITNTDVQIEVVMLCRNPLSWSRAHIQEVMKGGKNIKEAIEENNILPQPFYRTKIENLSKVFAYNSLHICRFEDIISHKYGPIGGILSIIGADAEIASQLQIEIHNQSPSYESMMLLNAINIEIPRVINHRLNPIYQDYRPKYIHQLPGQKFSLDAKQKEHIWKRDQDDIQWLCKTFNLLEYKLTADNLLNNSEKWNANVMQYLGHTLPEQPMQVKVIIFKELFQEFNKYRPSFSLKKKLMMFSYFIQFSSYFQLNTRIQQFQYVKKQIGLFCSLKLSFILILRAFVLKIKSSN
ncbi:MAG: hypothetical protein GQ527_07745 [Bacteroidales bacterium]|nr:hypothetical protein [Bacteroidales bacterium]